MGVFCASHVADPLTYARPTPARSILDEIPAESDNGARFMIMCLVVRSAESIGVAAYLTAVFAIIASEFKDSVTTAFVRFTHATPIVSHDQLDREHHCLW